MLSRNGISALQLKRELGIGSYSSAWRMLHQIRKAMNNDNHSATFETIVEIDETYVGGTPHNKHTQCAPNKRGRGTSKTHIIGVRERSTGRVSAVAATKNKDGKQISGKQLFDILKKVCKKDTIVMTDQFAGYNILDKDNECNFVRSKIDHTICYSLGNGNHTNGIENFWTIVKRGVYGIFHNIGVTIHSGCLCVNPIVVFHLKNSDFVSLFH